MRIIVFNASSPGAIVFVVVLVVEVSIPLKSV